MRICIKIENRYVNVNIGKEASQFHFWELINRILFSVYGKNLHFPLEIFFVQIFRVHVENLFRLGNLHNTITVHSLT
jgi:hypothetical protein